jgi:hypothetical protein
MLYGMVAMYTKYYKNEQYIRATILTEKKLIIHGKIMYKILSLSISLYVTREREALTEELC